MNHPDSTAQQIPADTLSIQVSAESGDRWSATIVFPTLEISDRELVDRLREAKKLIASRYEVPINQLELQEIFEKIPAPDGMIVHLTIGRVDLPLGAPVVHLYPLTSLSGSTYADMIVMVDLYPLDESGEPLNLERLKRELSEYGVDFGLCDFQKLEETIHHISQERSPLIGFEVARGMLPDEGTDAELDWGVFGESADEVLDSEQRMSCRVRKGDILCRKIPARPAIKAGKNVRGENIPPNKVNDFKLAAGEGVGISKDGLILQAMEEGIAILKRGTKLVEVRVRPIVKLTGGEITDLVLEDSVEIQGSLKGGSSVTTRGGFLLQGDVEGGSTIKAGDDVKIEGKIRSSEIDSDSSIYSNDLVQGSRINANKDVKLDGVVESSHVTGSVVKIRESRGSRIIASRKAVIQRGGNSEDGKKTTIHVGQSEYQKNKIETNQKAIQALTAGLKKMAEVFGMQNIARLKTSNLQQILIQHVNSLHLHGDQKLINSRVENLRKLLESVIPLKEMLAQKKSELERLKKDAEIETRNPVIEIGERNSDPIEVTIKDKTYTIPPSDKAFRISADPDEIMETSNTEGSAHQESKRKFSKNRSR